LPEENRREYLQKVAEELRSYEFLQRRQNQPEIKKSEHLENADLRDPKKLARLIITLMQPYYRAESQNKIKDWAMKYLSEEL